METLSTMLYTELLESEYVIVRLGYWYFALTGYLLAPVFSNSNWILLLESHYELRSTYPILRIYKNFSIYFRKRSWCNCRTGHGIKKICCSSSIRISYFNIVFIRVLHGSFPSTYRVCFFSFQTKLDTMKQPLCIRSQNFLGSFLHLSIYLPE